MMTVIYGCWTTRTLIRHRKEIRSWVNGNIIHLNHICSNTLFRQDTVLGTVENTNRCKISPCSQRDFSLAGDRAGWKDTGGMTNVKMALSVSSVRRRYLVLPWKLLCDLGCISPYSWTSVSLSGKKLFVCFPGMLDGFKT